MPKLTLKWAFGIPGASAVSAQPTVFAGRLFFGSENGIVYALDAATGCTHWQFKAGAGVRSAISVGPIAGHAAGRGTPRTSATSAPPSTPWTALTGEPIWSLKVDDHAAARITGGTDARRRPPVRAGVVARGAARRASRLSLLHLPRQHRRASTPPAAGRLWKTYTIPEAPQIVGKNAAGTPLWKPAGAAIWAAPTVDLARKVLYVATGNAYTEPAAPTSDAVIALALDTGAIQWVSQVTPERCRSSSAASPATTTARTTSVRTSTSATRRSCGGWRTDAA